MRVSNRTVWGGLFGLVWLGLCVLPALAQEETPRLFGTVEFRGPVKNLPSWLGMLERNGKNPIFFPGSNLNARVTWDKLRDMLKDKTPLEQIKGVNSFWNQWPYRLDMAVYGQEDYWAAPYEFRKNSGDCEDYSIAKYFTLKALGFDPHTLRIIVLKDTIRNIAHAVLVVYLNHDIYILDNVSNAVLSHTRLQNYVPQYSVNEYSRWAHVRPH